MTKAIKNASTDQRRLTTPPAAASSVVTLTSSTQPTTNPTAGLLSTNSGSQSLVRTSPPATIQSNAADTDVNMHAF